jgi:spore germination protein YaaH
MPTVIVIHNGDTLFGISQELNVSVNQLTQANPKVDPDNLNVGSTLNISSDPGFFLLVRSGDTAFEIANALGRSVESLEASQPSIDWNNLQIGTLITFSTPT